MKRLQWQSYHNEGDTMEDNFRNALIIISAVVIGAIFVHGLWTIHMTDYLLLTIRVIHGIIPLLNHSFIS